jgi:hypothetical protein
MHFTSLTPGETLHHYAFTNELATELVASLPIAGDANGDGIIDLADFQFISDNFLKTVAPGTLGDVNKDGVVNAKDHRLWQQEYSAIEDELLTQIPEPGTATLLCLWVSLSCLARSRREVSFCRAKRHR